MIALVVLVFASILILLNASHTFFILAVGRSFLNINNLAQKGTSDDWALKYKTK